MQINGWNEIVREQMFKTQNVQEGDYEVFYFTFVHISIKNTVYSKSCKCDKIREKRADNKAGIRYFE